MSAKWPTHVYILAPSLSESASKADQNLLLSNEYGKSDSNKQLQRILQNCNKDTLVNVIDITLDNMMNVVNDLRDKSHSQNLVVMNLCDGTETDGYPGLSVVQALESFNIAFTGANSRFYEDTTSKPYLKQQLVQAKVPTALFIEVFPGQVAQNIQDASHFIGWPMIVKPSVSYASLSISDKSVVHNLKEAIEQAEAVLATNEGGVFVETFLPGREFTALCTGNSKVGVQVYTVAERVFNDKLEDDKRILAFDRYWDGYGLDGSKPAGDTPQLYWYEAAPESFQEPLKEMAKAAYIACHGGGYGRVDIRTKSKDKPDAFVLEVNANCGLSFGKNSSSLGEILEISSCPPEQFCKSLIHFALNRRDSNTITL